MVRKGLFGWRSFLITPDSPIWLGLPERTPVVLFGEKLIEWLLLALGAAMSLGNLAALVRPPKRPQATNLARPPLWRSLSYLVLGVVVVVWALAGLLA